MMGALINTSEFTRTYRYTEKREKSMIYEQTYLEWRAGNELVGEFDADVIISGLSWYVLDSA